MRSENSADLKKRFTIGLIIDWIGPGYQMPLIEGIKDTLYENNANFICFEGSSLHLNKDDSLYINPIFKLAGIENCDGLILSSGNISQHIGDDVYEKFYSRYSSLPFVSLGRVIKNAPSIVIDNRTGIEELINHLIDFHGYRNFAVIRGPENSFDSDERYSAVIETLKKHSIVPEENSIITGDYKFHSGIDCIKRLLNKRSKFDAVIVANDSMAYGVIEELTYRGFHVPGDIAVVGFDNIIYPGTTSPPLTTINQPIYNMACNAAMMILDLIKGKIVNGKTVLPANVIVRETCGCLSHNILDSKISSYGSIDKNLKATLTGSKKNIIRSIMDDLISDFNINEDKYSGFLEQLMGSLIKELFHDNKNIFIKTLHYLIHLSLYNKEEIIIWEKIISGLRLNLMSHIDDTRMINILEDIFHESRIMISEKIIIGEQNRYFLNILDNELINYFRDEMQDIYDIERQFEIMTERFENLKVKSFFAAAYSRDYKNQEPVPARLIYAYKSGRLELSEGNFPSRILLPEKLYPSEENFFFIVTSFGYSSEQTGYLIFEFLELRPEIYLSMKRIINNSIQEAFFFKKINDQSTRLQFQKEELTKSLTELRKIMGGFIQTMSLTLEIRDPYTAGHQRRVSDLARAIATEMNLHHDMIEGIRMAGIIHDLGKIYIPVEILNKPTKLLDIEFELIKAHPQIAYDILKTVDFPWPIADIVLQHHEKLDGTGYPLGLKGDTIKLESCILSVADVVEAMTTYRPYRPALGIDVALNEISRFRDIKYKKEVVDACVDLFKNNKFQFKKE